MPIAQLILQGNFTVDANGGTFLEDSRVRLLEAIDEFGSISKAARQVPLSYKTAWDAVNAMTIMAGQALVVRTIGGAGGGGSLGASRCGTVPGISCPWATTNAAIFWISPEC